MRTINNLTAGAIVKMSKKFEELAFTTRDAFSTVEIIVLVIVILGLVSIFSSSAGAFITAMWTQITTTAQGLFG